MIVASQLPPLHRLAVLVVAWQLACAPKLLPRQASGPVPATRIEHLVIILQENHSFDNYFGSWCGGVPPPPSPENPGPSPHLACNEGRNCCETAFSSQESWTARSQPTCTPQKMSDELNSTGNPDHSSEAEWKSMHWEHQTFLMDRYPCDPSTAAVSVLPRESELDLYFQLVSENALADRYFQPIVGASCANDMFLARGGYVFEDNRAIPNNTQGSRCMEYCAYGTRCVTDRPNAPVDSSGETLLREYRDLTIGDLLDRQQVPWGVYMEGYQPFQCSGPYPWSWDPSDNPFNYYPQHRDGPRMRDFSQFAVDVSRGKLPSVVLIRSLGTRSEHPSRRALRGVRISDGQRFVRDVLRALSQSIYSANTLILITWDEGGGFFDHVSPPTQLADGTPLPKSNVHNPSATTTDGVHRPVTVHDPECFRCTIEPAYDGQQFYGARVPLIAVGPFTRKYRPGVAGGGYISHVSMEHSSIVKFIEWNWLGKRSGQLNTRDAHVNNLGSLLTEDPRLIGTQVPSGFSD